MKIYRKSKPTIAMRPGALHRQRLGRQMERPQPGERRFRIHKISLASSQEPRGLIYSRQTTERPGRCLEIKLRLGARALLLLMPNSLHLVLKALADFDAVARRHYFAVRAHVVE